MAEEKQGRTAKENIAYATNTAGMVAGPAAIAGALNARKEGGMPRQLMRRAVWENDKDRPNRDYESREKQNRRSTTSVKNVKRTKFGRTKLGRQTGKAVDWLDNPKSRNARIAAGAAGAGMVGLQVANWAGDTIASQTFKEKGEQPKEPVKKADFEGPATGTSFVPRGTGVGTNFNEVSKASGVDTSVRRWQNPYGPGDQELARQRRLGRNQALATGAAGAGVAGGAYAGQQAWKDINEGDGAKKVFGDAQKRATRAKRMRPGTKLGFAAGLPVAGLATYGAMKRHRERQEAPWR